MTLKEFFNNHPKVALAFSGGVDSAYLLYAALEAGADVRAYFVKSQFQPEFELVDARRLVNELSERFGHGTDFSAEGETGFLKILPVDVLADAAVASNPADRCYYCKQRIFGRILDAAEADGYKVILDGTNASDEEGDRPGMRALREMEVKSPLRLCGLTKDEIRRLSRDAGLFTWDKPSYACLATRIPTGQPITAEDLQRVEKAEALLEAMGFRDFRVRVLFPAGPDRTRPAARLQLKPEQMRKAMECRSEITEKLKPLFQEILLDMETR